MVAASSNPQVSAARTGAWIGGPQGLLNSSASSPNWVNDFAPFDLLKCKLVRCNCDTWSDIEPSNGKFNFAKPDATISALAARGYDFLYTLPISASWNGPYKTPQVVNGQTISPSHFPTTTPRYVYRFAKAVASRYPQIKYYEFWNEPDNPAFWAGQVPTSPTEYLTLLVQAYKGIKEVRPAATVLMGGLALPTDTTWFQGFLKAGGAKYCDAVNVHTYNESSGAAVNSVEAVRNVMAAHNVVKPIWVTEISQTGATFANAMTGEAQKAVYLLKSFAYLFSQPDVDRVVWHTLRALSGLDFSLINAEGINTEAFIAYQVWNAYLSDAQALAHVTSLPNLDLWKFTSASGGEVWVTWSLNGANASIPASALPTGYTTATAVTRLGSTVTGTPAQAALVPIDANPRIFWFR